MKYFMLVLFSGLYMSSIAYGKDCDKLVKGNAMSDAGALVSGDSTTTPGSGKH